MGLSQKKERKHTPRSEQITRLRKTNGQPISSAKFLAPAKAQSLPSSLIRRIRTDGKEDLLLKTLAFRSFHSSHVMSMMVVLRPLGEEEGVLTVESQ